MYNLKDVFTDVINFLAIVRVSLFLKEDENTTYAILSTNSFDGVFHFIRRSIDEYM